MPGSYLLHPHIPVIGTALPPRFPGKAKNDQNQGVGLILFYFGVVKAPFIITPPGIFGVTTSTKGENPKK
jgi:hypothetical protein